MDQRQLNELGFYVLAGAPQSPVELIDEVRSGEALGLGSTFISERFNIKEALTLSGAVGAVSSTLGIATAATNHNTKHPMVTASHATTMHRLTGGRFTLGLGRGIAPLFDAYGIPRITTAQIEDFVGILRRLWKGDVVLGHDGPAGKFPVLHIDASYDEDIPLGFVAFGPNSLALGGRCFDAVVLHTFFTDETVERCVATVRGAAEAAGRDPASVRIWSCYATIGDHLPEALRLKKTVGRLATYLQGYGDLLVETNGWDPEVLARFRADPVVSTFPGALDTKADTATLEHVATLLPDEWLEPAATGDAANCAARVLRQFDLGVDGVIMHGATPTELEPIVDAYPRDPTHGNVRRLAREPGPTARKLMPRERRKPTVAIIGAGAGGIAMGIKCKRAGYDFTIYEKSDGVGGTWRDNAYPGAACDVPSHLYSFSFELNPWWSRTYATQPEILAYLERCTDQYGIRPHVRTGVAITEAHWNEGEQQWTLATATGESFTADVVVSGLGMLNVPVVPAIPGAERFRGRAFHSSHWDHSKALAGERVGSIGTGASAIQYVPAIAPEVEHLTVFQRTPIWITPRLDKAFTPEEQRRFARVPFAARWHRWKIWWTYERADFAVTSAQTTMQTELARSYLERKIEDPDLRAQLTPDYPVGCKRPLISRNWLPALTRPNVRLVTEPIAEITDTGIRTADGEEHPLDTIIYGTGFRANEYCTAVDFYGRDGRRLRDDWRDGAEAFLGLTVSGYPNLFLLYGPNTNGVNSIIFMHEAQANYVMSALRTMRRRRVAALDVRPRVMRRYNRKIQGAMAGTVWTAGCDNYFRLPSGKVVTQLPYSGGRYWLRTRLLRPWQYRKTHA